MTVFSPRSRRSFLRTAAAAAPFFIVPRAVLGRGYLAPSDTIQLGFIGLGRQSEGLLRRFIATKQVAVLGASDVDALKVERFQKWHEKFVTTDSGSVKNQLQGYPDFNELLARPDLDAVVIATPDHWHAVQGIRAMQAGKDVYCEKPLTLTVAEGRAMVDAARRHRRVVQTGSMQRSDANFRKACELVRNGYLGTIREVLVTVGGPPVPVDFAEEPVPAHLHWDRWLGPNALHHYNHVLAPRLEDTFWGQWRNYKGFGGGGMTDWGAHMFDIAQWALRRDDSGPVELSPPTEPGAKWGLTYRYGDGVVMKHQDFGRGNAVRFIGTEGQLDISRGFFEPSRRELVKQELRPTDERLPAPENHYVDFLNAMRSRQEPICGVETGHRSCTVCNIGNIAYELRRPLTWNPKKERFKGDAEANALLSRTLREPYQVRL
jgi:predicted dehydrogenase